MVTRGKNDKDKKKKKVKRLKLNKETVKELSDSELDKVQGGMVNVGGAIRAGGGPVNACSTEPIGTPETGTACALYLCQKTWTCNLECI